ncbi:recombination protein RecF [Clostridium botulinum]|nr:recombination protein RecF [Clostridium botulinum]NFN46841.1 recombination protein RecF [Clostridium botulinum]NFR13661.1 recombination protein RecF [Clostridium botulinum]NFS51226.1 recombination protein RecF [Clostridium botulinum]
MYLINRLEINNFKLIDSKKVIDFSKSDLIVLDGPNGYGKTTIFDTIEILVKGNRNLDQVFNSEYRAGDKPVVYAFDKNKPIVLKGEFINELGEKFIVERKIEHPDNIGKISDLKDRFTAYELNSFEECEGKKITQKHINDKLGLYPNESIYNLMYYIQQEETLFFLKENEYKRKEKLNTLFNMEKECKEQSKILKLRDKLNSKRKQIGGEDGKGGEILTLDKEINEINIKDATDAVNVQYTRLISDKNIIWDNELLELDYDTFQKSIVEINKIKMLRENIKDYEAILYNSKIDFALDKRQEDILRGSFIINQELIIYDQRMKEIKMCNSYKRFVNFLKLDDYVSLKEMLDEDNELKSNLKMEFDIDKFYENLSNIYNSSKDTSQLDSLIININSIRRNLENEYEKYTSKNRGQDICPLCGYDYTKSNKKLRDKILEKEHYFSDQLENSNKILNKLIKTNKENFITPILEFLETQIKKKDINKDYKKLLDLANLNEKRVNNFNQFCNEHSIDLNKYTLDRENYTKEKEENNLNLLREELRVKKRKLEREDIHINKKEIDGIFSNIFDSDIEKVRKLTLININNKISYLENICSRQENIKRNKKLKKKELLVKKYLRLNDEYIKCKNIALAYKKCIDKYSDDIIKVLQIPLYIYSGKIIQDYQGGLGVFIRSEDGEQQLRLKFVNNNESKHDLLNKFSSGQLSGLILSIMMSLNKVFSNNKFNVLLIDDPLQSMDDINMTSFVELLRNEFEKSQVILSTHDERISRYIRYKFEKFNLKTIRYNVKEELKVQ